MEAMDKSLSSGLIGRLEQLVLSVPALWQQLSSLWRGIGVALLVLLMGFLSPTCSMGGYNVCLLDLAVGVPFTICLLVGPRYVVPAFVSIGIVYYIRQYAVLSDNVLFFASYAAIAVWMMSWLMRRQGVGLGAMQFNRKTAIFIFVALILPLVAFSLLEYFGVNEILERQSPLSGTFIYNKMLLQTLIAPYLGIALSFALGQPLQGLTPRGVFVFVRLVLFAIVGLAIVFSVYNSQLATEKNAEIARLSNQALYIKNAIEQQFSLVLRSACDFEYSTVDCHLGLIDDAELQRRCDVVKNEDTPWVFVESVLAEPNLSPPAYGKDANLYRLAAMSIMDVNPFEDVWRVGSYLNDKPSFKVILNTLQDVNSSANKLISERKSIVFQTDNLLMLERGCYCGDQLVGVVGLGLNVSDFVRVVLSKMDLSGFGIKANYYNNSQGSGTGLVPCYSNTDYLFSGILSVHTDVTIDCGKPIKMFNFTVSAMPEYGIFLMHCLEDFVIYVVCLLISMVMASGLFEQYCIVEERAREQVRVREAMDLRYEIIASTMREALGIVDLSGKIVSANRVGLEFLGCSLQEAVGKPLHSFSHRGLPCQQRLDCPTCQFFVEMRRRLTSGESVADMEARPVHDRVFTGEGKPVNHITSYSHIRTNTGEMMVVMLGRNVDEQMRLQKVRSDYVATLSHDMRTPLACIKGTLEMFAKFAPKMISEQGLSNKGHEMLDLGRRNVDKLNQLINDVLLCDSVEDETLQINTEIQDVAPILHHVVDSLAETASKQGLKLVTGAAEGRANVDSIRLDQILSNLVGNAIKYSSKGGEIFVEAKVHPADNVIVFLVKDQGQGIPEEKLPTIFDRYEVVNSDSTRMYGGLGLGLTICRGLVKAMGGDIWVESTLGKGSTFSFTLPLYVEDGKAGDSDAR